MIRERGKKERLFSLSDTDTFYLYLQKWKLLSCLLFSYYLNLGCFTSAKSPLHHFKWITGKRERRRNSIAQFTCLSHCLEFLLITRVIKWQQQLILKHFQSQNNQRCVGFILVFILQRHKMPNAECIMHNEEVWDVHSQDIVNEHSW